MVMKEVCSLYHREGNEEVSTLRTLQGNAALELLGQCADQLQAKGLRYASRKRDTHGKSTAISRQQGWHRLPVLMQANGINPYLQGTHVLRKSSAAAMMKLSKDITVGRDGLCHASSATTDKYLKSDERAFLIIAEAMGQQMLGAAA
jgi:site-specific recombinase XerC